MKQSSKTLRKMLAVALAVATIGSAGMTANVASVVGLNTSVSAANMVIVTHGDFTYYLYSDHTAEIVSYNGTKDLSTKSLGCPSVVYAKDLDQYYFNGYTGSYTVKLLQASAFNGCKIRVLGLPNSLQTIFGGFKNTEIGVFTISTNNPYFSTSNGFLTDKSGTVLIAYPSKPSLYYTGSDFIYIPNTVTSIDMYAFTSYKATSITIPSTVTYVGNAAFEYSSLQTITFSGCPSFYQASGESVCSFDNATKLYSIKINGTNGNYSTDSYGMLYNKDKTKFIYCPLGRTSAFNVADTCTEIVDWAFHNSSAKPVIYDNVTKISSIAFDGVKSGFKLYCLKDTTVETFAKNNNINYGYHFEYTVSGNNVTVTKYSGPYNGPSLPEKVKGKTITAIGAEAFKGNTTLDGIYLSSTKITSIGDKAFYGCTSLKNIYLPSTVTSIGKDAFYNTAATSITIPSSMTSIGEEAFYGMFKLESVTIPSKVTSIGKYAFGFDTALTSVKIPNNVTSLGFAAFYGCSKLSSLTIGTGLTSIGGSAFCNTALTSQYIPKTVTSIGSYAFGYKYADSTYTRDSAFTQISGYPNTAAQTYCKNYNVPFKSLLRYSTSSDGKSIQIEKYTGTDTVVVIPDKIDGLPVTSIARYAFDGTNVTKITLPSGMTALDGYALYGASKLTTVVFPSGLTSIGEYAFEFCTSLKSITIPNTVTSIGNGAFYACNQLASVNLGTGVKTIGGYAFENTALTSVTIPKSVTSIGAYAFGDKWENSTHTMVSGFKITGYAYTEAETYANKYSITFNPLYEAITNNSTISKTAITLGQSVTINFASTGGKRPMTYAAMYSLDGGSSVSICSYSTNTSTTFTPTSAGTYNIYTYAKDDRGQLIRKDLTLTVAEPVSNTSTINMTTATVGDKVTVTASATGGSGSYTYKFSYTRDGISYWTDATGSNNTCTFVPNYADTYHYKVVATDSNGKTDEKVFDVKVYAKLVNNSKIASQAIKPSENVQLNASATGGDGNYVYTVEYARVDVQSEWQVVYDGTGSDISFKLPSTGEYAVCIRVTDGTGKYENLTFNVVVENNALVNESTMSADTIALGKKVTFTGKASGGTGTYQYAFLYKKASENKWVNKQSFAANDTVSIKPEAAVDYDVCIKVKDSSGTVEKKYFILHVNEALESASTISSLNIGKGQTVTVSAAGKNGVGPYTYSVLYKQKSKTKWTTKQDFSQNSQIEVKPASTGLYDVCVKVKDSLGTIAKTYFEVNVAAAVTSNSTISATEIKKGESVTVKAAAQNGIAPYTYSVQYKQQSKSKWTTQQEFDANDTIVVTPASAVAYDICVKVQDGTGTVAKQYFVVTVK